MLSVMNSTCFTKEFFFFTFKVLYDFTVSVRGFISAHTKRLALPDSDFL
jgi:hypothetical protein